MSSYLLILVHSRRILTYDRKLKLSRFFRQAWWKNPERVHLELNKNPLADRLERTHDLFSSPLLVKAVGRSEFKIQIEDSIFRLYVLYFTILEAVRERWISWRISRNRPRWNRVSIYK